MFRVTLRSGGDWQSEVLRRLFLMKTLSEKLHRIDMAGDLVLRIYMNISKDEYRILGVPLQ